MALAEYVQELEGRLAKQQASAAGHQGAQDAHTGDCACNLLHISSVVSSVHVLEGMAEPKLVAQWTSAQ